MQFMRFYRLLSFIAAISLISVLFFGFVSVPASAQSDTMQFRYNAQHTGDYSVAAGSTQPNGNLRWNFTIGGHLQSPVVSNGIVYIACANYTDSLDITYGAEVFIYAINAKNGAEVWRATLGNVSYPPTPAVANGAVFIGSSDGNVYALNAVNGDKLWVYSTEGAVYSPPAVVNGVVYVGSNDTVYALNANTGAKLWGYKTSGSISSSPAVDNGIVYVSNSGHLISNRTYSTEAGATELESVYHGEVYALWANTGKKYWNYTTGGQIWSSPAIVNGIVYVGSNDHNIYALANGNKLWNYTTGGSVVSSPAVVNGVVYVGSDDWNYYAINSATGTRLWSYIIGNTTNGCTSGSSPAVANGVVYITAGNGDLYALDAGAGTLKWLYKTGYNMHVCPVMAPSPAIADGIAYLSSEDGNVYAIGNAGQSAISIPGFEVVFAVIGLAIVAFIVSKKR